GPSLSGRSIKALGQGEEPEASSDDPDDGNVLVRGSGAARRGLADLIQQTHNLSCSGSPVHEGQKQRVERLVDVAEEEHSNPFSEVSEGSRSHELRLAHHPGCV